MRQLEEEEEEEGRLTKEKRRAQKRGDPQGKGAEKGFTIGKEQMTFKRVTVYRK